MDKGITFSNAVEKVTGEGGWHIVRLPDDVLALLKEMSGKKGNVPVVVTIGKTTYPTTIMSMGNQQWFFAVKSEVRKAESINEGDTVQVGIVPDFERIKD